MIWCNIDAKRQHLHPFSLDQQIWRRKPEDKKKKKSPFMGTPYDIVWNTWRKGFPHTYGSFLYQGDREVPSRRMETHWLTTLTDWLTAWRLPVSVLFLPCRERVPCQGKGVDEGASPEDHAQEGSWGELGFLHNKGPSKVPVSLYSAGFPL